MLYHALSAKGVVIGCMDFPGLGTHTFGTGRENHTWKISMSFTKALR